MQHSTISLSFEATDVLDGVTSHGLLFAAVDFASRLGFFKAVDHHLSLTMKTRDYSWQTKLATLWASILVGCDHTSQINDSLGAHERAAAALFGLERFPDQSQINRLLHAFSPDHVASWRALHLDLLAKHSRARRRRLWSRLANQHKVLFLDLDQRGLTVSSNRFELAAKGYFSRKRSRTGYQLSLAFFGGPIGEVLDEYLDPGKTPAAARLDPLLDSALAFCHRTRVRPDQVVVRGDAQYGTPEIIKKIEARGFHFLFKGLSSSRARALFARQSDEAVFLEIPNGANREPAFIRDLGVLEHRHGRKRSHEHAVTARTMLLVRHVWVQATRRAGPKERAERKAAGTDRRLEQRLDYFLTSLDERQLPPERVLETYHDRSTIERYFYDEAYGLGARQVRTHHLAGQSVFQFLVATTNNLLRWMKHSLFKNTPVERMGICRLVQCAMHIPAKIVRCGRRILVKLPARHHLVRALARTWAQMLPPEPST
jgi:hypothetical protein